MLGIKERLEMVDRAQQTLAVRKSLLLESAMRSDNPSDIIKAAQIFNQQSKPGNSAPRAYLIDPLEFNSFWDIRISRFRFRTKRCAG